MNVVIRDLQENGVCDYTGKETEVVVCSLDEQTPDAVLSTQEFFRQLRFRKRQQEKLRNGPGRQSGGAKATTPEPK